MPKRVGFTYHQSLVQYRVPYFDDGTFGTPEVTSRFTSDIKGTKKAPKNKKNDKGQLASTYEEEEV